jgi:uncharacterized delta-60 repeat protein
VNRILLGSIVAVGMTLAACSSDDNDAGSTTPVATTPATTADTGAPDTTAPDTTEPDATRPSTTENGTEDTTPRTTAPGGSAGSAVSGLDDGFGTSGLVAAAQSATEDDRFISVAEGPDGAIYTAGFTATGDDHMFAVSRYTADGEPDEAFGDGGTASINVAEGGGSAEVARGLVVEDDGTVLVAGPFEQAPDASGDAAKDLDVAVVRLDAAGALDPTFGEGGIARFDLGAGKAVDAETYVADNAWGLTARAGGYAIFAVTPNQEPDRTDADYAIVGITDDGALDDTFGTAGVVIADVDAGADTARTIRTTDDGSIVATGYSRDGDGVVSPVLIKVSAAGVLDEAFGDGGIANHIILPGVTESYAWAPQGDDYILAGYGRGADSEEKVDLVVYRFLADGSWDETFGTDGLTRVDLAGEDDRGRNVTVLPDGSIVAVGSGKLDADNIDAMVVMLDPDGAPVPGFGDGGHLLVDLGGPADAFFGVAVTADESAVLLAGFKGADPDGTENDDGALARIAL